MRDMFLGAIILGWTYMAAHAGTLHISGLFDLVNATLDHVLAQIG